MTSGGTPSSSVSRYYGGGIPWVSISDMTTQGKYIPTTERTLSDAGIAASAAKLYDPNVVLYAMYASIGECSIAVGQVSSSQAILGISVGASLDREYLYYYLQHIKSRVKLLGQQGTQANLNAGMVRDFDMPLPEMDEQRRISRILADVDELLAGIERMIAKKRAVKNGLMRELLSGCWRLPGYTQPWSDVAVLEILEFKNGLNKASQYFGHGTPIVNFMDVIGAPIITADRVRGLVSLTRDEIARFSARPGDMFFTRTSESVDEIGTAAVLTEDIPNAVFSGFVLRGRAIAPVNTTFLAYQFQLPSIRRQVIATASYTTRALTNGGSLGRVKILLPHLDEQAAIAAVMADADAELTALERRRESARAIKTGMMQELFTSRTRLPVPVAS